MTEIISLVNDCISGYFSVDKSCLYRHIKNYTENDAKGFCWLILHDIYYLSHNQLSKEYKSDIRNIQRKIYKYRDYIKIYSEYDIIFNEIIVLLDSDPN